MANISLTIGIPAHNEEINIVNIINSIICQKQKGYCIEKIIICSDGSDDKTVEEVKKLSIPFLDIIEGKVRKGKSARLREIINKTQSDFLLLLDADILITSDTFLYQLLIKTNAKQYDLIAGETTPLAGLTFFEKSINHGVETIQKVIRKKWKKGNNYLAFNGRCMLFSKKFYSTINLPSGLTNIDAYFYFYAKSNLLETKHTNLSVFYRSPGSFTEYLAQALRFRNSHDTLIQYFSEEILLYKIPRRLLIITFIKSLFLNPIYFVSYFSIYIAAQIIPNRKINALWSYNVSTKKIFASA